MAADALAPRPSGTAISGVLISHERPAPETEPHVIAPLVVSLPDGQRIVVRNWSLTGIRDQQLAGRNLAGARLVIPFQGVDVGFPVRLTPSAEGDVWTFGTLTGRQREALGLFYRNLITGKMAAVGDVITALDTPVDLIPMGETEAEKLNRNVIQTPRVLRTIAHVAGYVLMFALVFGYLGHVGWSRYDHMLLSNARYAAPVQELTNPAPGVLADIAVSEGQEVAVGDLLMRLHDPELASNLAVVLDAVALVEARLTDARQRLAAHMFRRAEEREASGDQIAFDAGQPLRPGDFHDIRQRLEQEVRLIELELRGLSVERGQLREAERALDIRAPNAGWINRIIAPLGSFQPVDASLLVFEEDTPRTVIGWLSATEASHVWPGMRATVHYAADGQRRSISAHVSKIDAGAGVPRPGPFGLLVHLAVEGLTPDEMRALLPHNAAVEVRLHRDLARRWFGIGE